MTLNIYTKLLLIALMLVFASVLLLSPLRVARAESWVAKIIKTGDELIPKECRVGAQPQTQPCEIRHVIQVIVNITRLILGLIGSVALFMFIYGGFMFLISAGSSEKVQTAKKILSNAVMGIVIVFTSWILVNLLILALSSDQPRPDLTKPAEVFDKDWTKGL